MSTKLTPHFTLEEMTKTSTGLNNRPYDDYVNNLRTLCRDVLEPIRSHCCNLPIIVNSAFRTTAVNRAVGGKGTSQHLKGQAADIYVKNWFSPSLYNIIKSMVKNGDINVGQCILYRNFVHVSLPTKTHKNDFLILNK